MVALELPVKYTLDMVAHSGSSARWRAWLQMVEACANVTSRTAALLGVTRRPEGALAAVASE